LILQCFHPVRRFTSQIVACCSRGRSDAFFVMYNFPIRGKSALRHVQLLRYLTLAPTPVGQGSSVKDQHKSMCFRKVTQMNPTSRVPSDDRPHGSAHMGEVGTHLKRHVHQVSRPPHGCSHRRRQISCSLQWMQRTHRYPGNKAVKRLCP
jgi:hypothetical protein